MKQLKLFFLMLSGTIALQAQFFYYPFPPSKQDYVRNEKAKVKICNEYQLTGSEKSLSRTLEYGNEGFPAALYETGLRYDGNTDTIITGDYYKYKDEKLTEDNMVYHYQGDTGYKIVYDYDTSGKLLSEIIVDIDPAAYIYKYDKSGKIIRADISVRMPDNDGNPVDIPNGRNEYSYNRKGLLIQETQYTKDNEKQFIVKWEYNSKGQIIKVSGISAENQSAYEELLEYGENGLLSKRTMNKPDEETEIYVYEYCTDCKQSWKE